MDFDRWLQETTENRHIEPIVLDVPIPITEIPTPALLLDEAKLLRNLNDMAELTRSAGLALRPHSKMHKSPMIAHLQLAHGASGICCAKVSEAEAMQRAGVNAILITSPVRDERTLGRVAKLAQENQEMMIVIDAVEAAVSLNQALEASGQTHRLKVLIDINPGLGRTGIAPEAGLLELAGTITESCNHLEFWGLQVYAGHCMHIESVDKRFTRYQRALAFGESAITLLTDAGYEIHLVSGGGTGSIEFEEGLGLLTEVQAGSYAFMDIEYRDIESRHGPIFDRFEIALSVLVTAISQPKSGAITVDAGFKSLASDKMAPEFLEIEGLTYFWGGDEHGIVRLDNPSVEVELGGKFKLITPHCDPTVNLHDYYYLVREEAVHELWPVSTRGCSQ